MAITISGENNNDRILASDGVIDQISGINIVGVLTATTFSGDFIGDLTGNVTGNINNSTLLLQTGGYERVRISSVGELTSTATQANVATFTSNQTASTIYVKDTDGDGIFISGSSAYGHRIYTNTTEDLLLGVNSTEKVRITNSGKVGINTNNPSQMLTVRGTILKTRGDSGVGLIYLQNDGSQNGQIVINQNGGVTKTLLHSAGDSYFNGGKLFVGTTSGNQNNKIIARLSNASLPNTSTASVILAENNGNSWITIGSAASSYGGILFADSGSSDIGQIRYLHGDNRMEFIVNTSERARITSDGKFGIGNFTSGTAVSQALHVKGSAPEIFLEHTGGYDMTLTTSDGMGMNGITVNGGFLSLAYNNKNIVMCRTGGQVRLGNTDITTSSAADDLIIGPNTPAGDHGITIISGTSGVGNIYFSDTDTTGLQNRMGTIAYYHNGNYMRFSTNGNQERLRIDSDGNVSIGSAPGSGAGLLNIRPGSGDDTYLKFRRAADFNASFDGTAIDSRNSANNANKDLLVRFNKCAIWAGGTEKISIANDGKINIGNATLSDPWSRTGNTNAGVRLVQSTQSYAISANSNEIVAIFNRTSGVGNGTILELKYDNSVVASLGSSSNSFTQNITIDSSASAALGLNRANTSSGAVIDFKTNGSVKWYMGLRGLVNDNFYIRNESGSTDALTILTNGRVGVNHTAPTAPLDVKGADDGINIRSDVNDRPHLNMINGSTIMLRMSCNSTQVDFGDANSDARYMTFDPESDHSIIRMNAQTYVKSPVARSGVYYHGAGFQYRDDSNVDHPVLHIQATSNGGGVNNIVCPTSKIIINGKSIGGSGRSWKLTVIKGSGSNIGQVIHHQTYDVYGNGTSEATNYVNALSTYTTDKNVIIVTTSDEPSSHAGAIRTALRDTYGAKDSMYNYFRYAYVFAFRHGFGTLGEQNSIYWDALNSRSGGGSNDIKTIACINFTVCL